MFPGQDIDFKLKVFNFTMILFVAIVLSWEAATAVAEEGLIEKCLRILY